MMVVVWGRGKDVTAGRVLAGGLEREAGRVFIKSLCIKRNTFESYCHYFKDIGILE